MVETTTGQRSDKLYQLSDKHSYHLKKIKPGTVGHTDFMAKKLSGGHPSHAPKIFQQEFKVLRLKIRFDLYEIKPFPIIFLLGQTPPFVHSGAFLGGVSRCRHVASGTSPVCVS